MRRRSGAFSNSDAIPRAAAGVVPVYTYIYIYCIHVPHDHTTHSRGLQYNTRTADAVVVGSRWRAGGRYDEDVFNWLLFQKNYEFLPYPSPHPIVVGIVVVVLLAAHWLSLIVMSYNIITSLLLFTLLHRRRSVDSRPMGRLNIW